MILVMSFRGYSQGSDYRVIFGKEWEKAEAFLAENEGWMKQMSAKYNISYKVAAAVVFPELVRYSAIRDRIEITLLKALYINLGNNYSDFSIGPFQMKPSFAESVCSKAVLLNDRISIQFRKKIDVNDPREFRRNIVSDLEEAHTQFVYLAAFIKSCYSSFGLGKMSEDERIRILSTAYNCGPGKSLERIRAMVDQKYFNTKLYSTENYSYSEVALCWYRNYCGDTETSR
jgi:hypothetical protein